MEQGAVLECHLRDGRTVRGTLNAYDQDMIVLNVAEGLECVIRKVEIRYLHDG